MQFCQQSLSVRDFAKVWYFNPTDLYIFFQNEFQYSFVMCTFKLDICCLKVDNIERWEWYVRQISKY